MPYFLCFYILLFKLYENFINSLQKISTYFHRRLRLNYFFYNYKYNANSVIIDVNVDQNVHISHHQSRPDFIVPISQAINHSTSIHKGIIINYTHIICFYL